jgi:hypothetical protein
MGIDRMALSGGDNPSVRTTTGNVPETPAHTVGRIEKLIEVYMGLAVAHSYMPTECIGAARAELAELRGRRRQSGAFVTLERLREIEFAATSNDESCDVCPVCREVDGGQNHKAECWLAAAIRDAEAVKHDNPASRE